MDAIDTLIGYAAQLTRSDQPLTQKELGTIMIDLIEILSELENRVRVLERIAEEQSNQLYEIKGGF